MSIFRSPEPEGMAAVELMLEDYLDLGLILGGAMTPYRGLLVAAVAQATVAPALLGGAGVVRDAYACWAGRYGIDPSVVRSLKPEMLVESAGRAPARVWLEEKARLMDQSPADYAREHFALSLRLTNRLPAAREDRIKIAQNPSSIELGPRWKQFKTGSYYWRHFLPIVEFCLDNGCRIDGASEKMPFTTDMGGINQCLMVGPITLHDVLDIFEFPDTFKVVHEKLHKIEDFDNRTLFYLVPEEEDARQKATGKAFLAHELARREARRQARAEAAFRVAQLQKEVREAGKSTTEGDGEIKS